MSLIAVRDYAEADKAQFLAVARDLQSYEVSLYDRMMPVSDIGDWYIAALQKMCVEEDGTILVAEASHEIVGFATIFTRVTQMGEIDEVAFTYAGISHIAVKSGWRGKGIGKLLLGECERRARQAGCKWLRLGVLANNGSARGLYEKLGFHDHLVIMEKSLALE